MNDKEFKFELVIATMAAVSVLVCRYLLGVKPDGIGEYIAEWTLFMFLNVILVAWIRS